MSAPTEPFRHRDGVPEPAAVAALTEALFDDPFYQSITVDFAHDPARRRSVLAQYLVCSMDEAARHGLCLVARAPGEGAAIWSLPLPSPTQAEVGAAKSRQLATVLGARGHDHYLRIVAAMAPFAEGLVPADAWYLSIVGIAPRAQGRGAGARLLAPTLAQARAAGAACFLETFTPRNLPFYARLGFREVGRTREPTTGSDYVVMLRDA